MGDEAPADGVERVWTYVPLASEPATATPALGLRPAGDWDPAEDLEAGPRRLHGLAELIIAAGRRPLFEMEQVIPGVAADDWDIDPVADAAELSRRGDARAATQILEGLVAQDERCIDAWVHLGNMAFEHAGPETALPLYDRAVAIGEQALGSGFFGVLSWGFVDNRPFLRALHGLGLCAWRQGRWEDAEAVFSTRAWVDGGVTVDSIWCFDQVRARRPWRDG